LKEALKIIMGIRLVTQGGKSKGKGIIEFKTEADVKKAFEEKQVTGIDGRSISFYYTGEKVQRKNMELERKTQGLMNHKLWF
jgi:nucleolin